MNNYSVVFVPHDLTNNKNIRLYLTDPISISFSPDILDAYIFRNKEVSAKKMQFLSAFGYDTDRIIFEDFIELSKKERYNNGMLSSDKRCATFKVKS